MNMDLSLYLVTDRLNFSEEEFLNKVELACKSGVTFVQLREKGISTREYIYLGEKVKAITDRYDIPLVIDDRVDVALAIDAHGVHIGDTDMDVSTARKLLGTDKIIGATAKDVIVAREAEKQGADYIGTGAIFPTTTKVVTKLTTVETLTEVVNSVSIPAVAIGGLDINNINVLKGTGIKGIAVVSAIMKADNVETKTKELKKSLEDIL